MNLKEEFNAQFGLALSDGNSFFCRHDYINRDLLIKRLPKAQLKTIAPDSWSLTSNDGPYSEMTITLESLNGGWRIVFTERKELSLVNKLNKAFYTNTFSYINAAPIDVCHKDDNVKATLSDIPGISWKFENGVYDVTNLDVQNDPVIRLYEYKNNWQAFIFKAPQVNNDNQQQTKQEIKQEVNMETKTQNKSFWDQRAEELKKAGIRMAGEQLETVFKQAFLAALTAEGVSNEHTRMVAGLLDTEVGTAFMSFALGNILDWVPWLKNQPGVSVVAEELRVKSMADAGNTLMEKFMRHIVPSLTVAVQNIPGILNQSQMRFPDLHVVPGSNVTPIVPVPVEEVPDIKIQKKA